MSVTIVITAKAREGARDILIDALARVLPDTRAFDGCQGVEVVCPRSQPGAVILIERWVSLEHFEAYKKWRIESGTTVLGSGLVEGRPATIVCDPTEA